MSFLFQFLRSTFSLMVVLTILFHLFSHLSKHQRSWAISVFISECCSNRQLSSSTGRLTNSELESDISFGTMIDQNIQKTSIFINMNQCGLSKEREKLSSLFHSNNLIRMHSADEKDHEFLDWVRPQNWNGRNKKKQSSSKQQRDQSKVPAQGSFEEVLQMVEKDEKYGSSEDICNFQPDNTMSHYQNELTFLQEDPSASVIKPSVSEIWPSASVIKPSNKPKTSQRFPQKVKDIVPLIKVQTSTVILECKPFKELKADVLFIPFRSSELEYYPGKMLKDRLESEVQKIKSSDIVEGGIYIKNKHKVGLFRFLVFVKVGQETKGRDIATGLDSLIAKSKNVGLGLTSFMFCLEPTELSSQDVLEGLTLSKELKQSKSPLTFEIIIQKAAHFESQKKLFRNLSQKMMK